MKTSAARARKTPESALILREFFANISHELRTPVTAIKGYAQTLKQGGLDDVESRMSFIDAIERNADRLTRLIEDLLRISRLAERPVPRRRTLALGAFTRTWAEDLAPLAEERGVSVHIGIPSALKVSADPAMLIDAVQNLIVNALRHSRPGGRVRIAARAVGNEARIVVSDAGVGIFRKDLPRLFERFYRTRGMRKSPGAGLGLSIVKQIVAAHGGRISATRRTDKGTDVTFTLSLGKAR